MVSCRRPEPMRRARPTGCAGLDPWAKDKLPRMHRTKTRWWPLPLLPYPHFMALAPLDVWARLLFCPGASIPIRYWPRLFFALATSAMVTVVTLLERLLLGLWLLRKAETWLPTSAPIFILGYY